MQPDGSFLILVIQFYPSTEGRSNCESGAVPRSCFQGENCAATSGTQICVWKQGLKKEWKCELLTIDLDQWVLLANSLERWCAQRMGCYLLRTMVLQILFACWICNIIHFLSCLRLPHTDKCLPGYQGTPLLNCVSWSRVSVSPRGWDLPGPMSFSL